MHPEEIVEPALQGRVHIEFTEVTLERKGSNGADTVTGKGYVKQEGDYFDFVFFHSGQLPNPFYYMVHLTQDGLIIQDNSFFTAHCISVDGRRWSIEDILPNANAGPGGVIVRFRPHRLKWREKLPAELDVHVATLYFLGKHGFPTNEIKHVETKIGGDQSLNSWSMSIAKIKGVPDIDISIEQLETYVTLSALSKTPLVEHFPLSAWQCLEFMFGQQLCCVAVVCGDGDLLTGTLETWEDPKSLPNVEPPIEPYRIDNILAYWELFSKVLIFLLGQSESAKALASASGEVISVGHTLLGVQAKIKSVAVETLANEIGTEQNSSTLKERTALSEYLGAAGYPESFVARLNKMVENMDSPAAKDTLHELKRKGLVDKKHIENWNRLRNKFAHGAVVTPADAATAFNRMRIVVGLFYRLAFHLVGYTGISADYLNPPKAPIKIVKAPKKEDPPPSAS